MRASKSPKGRFMDIVKKGMKSVGGRDEDEMRTQLYGGRLLWRPLVGTDGGKIKQ